MKIGILSDTHGFFHPALEEYLKDTDLIIHAGDIGSIEILERLEDLAPVKAVFGNVDGKDIRVRLPEQHNFFLDGLSFRIVHIAGRPGRWAPGILPHLKKQAPNIFICGHSHILLVERVKSLGNMLFINPGAAGIQGFHREKTCVRLFIEGGKAENMEVVHLDTV